MIGCNEHVDRVSLFSWGHDLASSEEEALLQIVTKVLAGAVNRTRAFSTPEKRGERVSRLGITPRSAGIGDHVWTLKEVGTLLGAARTPRRGY
jgi:hypothetical protein